MKIEITVKEEIVEYCRVNEIPDISKFINKILLQGYTIEKFGVSPYKTTEVEKIVEKEVIKEVYITDDSQSKELSEKIKKLEEECDLYKKDSEHFQKEWNSTLQKLELEQNKNKRDFYGE